MKSPVLSQLKKNVHALVLMPDKKPLGLTEVERKLFNVMLKISMETKEPRMQADGLNWFQGTLTEMGARLGMSRDQMGTQFYLQACRNLMGVVLNFQSPSTSDSTTEEGEITRQKLRHLVEKVDVVTKDGGTTVFWRFDSEMEPYLLNPERFALLSLESIAGLTSGASIALYEICARYVATDSGSTGWKPWAWWVSALTGTPTAGAKRSKTYSEFRYFNQLVLKPSTLEICKKTEINLVMEVKKEGRTVTEIRFMATRKNSGERMTGTTPATSLPLKVTELLGRATSLGVPSLALEKLLKKFPFESVDLAVNSLFTALQQREVDPTLDPIRSNGAYVKGVLERMHTGPEKVKAAKLPEASALIHPNTTPVATKSKSTPSAQTIQKSESRQAFESLPANKRQGFIDLVIHDIEERAKNSAAKMMDGEMLIALQNSSKPLVGIFLAPVLTKFNEARSRREKV